MYVGKIDFISNNVSLGQVIDKYEEEFPAFIELPKSKYKPDINKYFELINSLNHHNTNQNTNIPILVTYSKRKYVSIIIPVEG